MHDVSLFNVSCALSNLSFKTNFLSGSSSPVTQCWLSMCKVLGSVASTIRKKKKKNPLFYKKGKCLGSLVLPIQDYQPRLPLFLPELTLLVEKTHFHLLLYSQRPLQSFGCQFLALGTRFSSGFSMPLNNHIWRKVKLLLISNYRLIWRSLTSVWIYYENLGT